MRILKIIHGYPPTYNAGSEVYSQSLCNELSKSQEVHVFTREEIPYLPDFNVREVNSGKNLTFHILNKRFDKDGFRHKAVDDKFLQLVKKIKPDIAHIGHLNHLSTGIIYVLKSLNIPIVFTLHDFWLMCPRGQFLQRNFGSPDFFQICDRQEDRKCATQCYNMYFSGVDEQEGEIVFWTRWISKRMEETHYLTRYVDLFIAPSHYLRKRFMEDFGIPSEKILYLDYGFSKEYLFAPEKKKSNHFTFGYIGTHIPSKGVNLLVEAFIELSREENLPCQLFIFGRSQGQNTEYLKSISQGYKVEFRDEYINQEIVPKVFSEIDCIVVPSIWAENSPLVIHEAQEAKVPVITADFGGMKEYVVHEVNGLLFKHRDKEDLKNKMKYALQNPLHIQELGKKGYLYSETGKVPSIEEHCERILEAYKEILSQKALQ